MGYPSCTSPDSRLPPIHQPRSTVSWLRLSSYVPVTFSQRIRDATTDNIRVDLTNLGHHLVIRTSGSRTSRWLSLHDCPVQAKDLLSVAFTPFWALFKVLSPGEQSDDALVHSLLQTQGHRFCTHKSGHQDR